VRPSTTPPTYYATDAAALDKKLFGSADALTESFTSPSGLFYVGKVWEDVSTGN
jgi:hypothetical protein